MFLSVGRLGGDGGIDGRSSDLIADLCRERYNYHMGIISWWFRAILAIFP